MKKIKKPALNRTGLAQTGNPLDKIDINPQLKNSNDKSQQESVVDLTPPINEGKALTLSQRQKRSRLFKRILPKVERAREMAARKIAGPEKLEVRAMVAARELLKRKLASRKGVSYELLSVPEKIAVDKKLEKKQQLIKKIAARLLPRIRRQEYERFKSFIHGDKLQDLSTNTTVASESYEDMTNEQLLYSINEMVKELEEEKDPVVNIIKEAVNKIYPLNSIQESLMNKAISNKIPYDILEQVYERGSHLWEQSNKKQSQQQYSFSRVNSYIAGGKAFNEDYDLREEEDKRDTKDVDTKGRKRTVERQADYKMVKVRLPDGRVVWRKYKKSLKVDKEREAQKEKRVEQEKRDNNPNQPTNNVNEAFKKKFVIEKEVWDSPSPKKTHKKLTPAQKAKAKARAKAAGRKYPNLIDNMRVASEQKINESFSLMMDKVSGVGKMVTADQAGINIKSSFALVDGMEELTVLNQYESEIKNRFDYILFEATDEEGRMARGELSSLVKKAQNLISKMKDRTQLDAWVQSKITKSADYINSVHDYLNNNKQDVNK